MKLLITLLLFTLSSLLSANELSHKLRQSTSALLNALTPEQTKSMLGELSDEKNRWHIRYTGGTRFGLQIKDLTAEQRSLLDSTLSLLLSEKGIKLAHKVADQDDGLGNYYIASFGDPRKEKNFAFRLAEHHLTVVQAIITDDELKEFGPILLGSNPPKIWKEEEEKLLHLWQTIDDDSYLQVEQKAIASQPLPIPAGQTYSALNPTAQAAFQAAWAERISIFTPDVRQHLHNIIVAQGGWENARLSFYHEAPMKRCIDGGLWDFKCNVGDFFWDFEGSREHIHMSIVLK